MAQLTIQQVLQQAMQHHQAGRLRQAEEIYRKILARQPKQPDALQLLGIVAYQRGQFDAAINLIGRAISILPNVASYHNNLGNALHDKGELDQALTAYRQALKLNPNDPEAHNNSANILLEKGLIDESISACLAAIRLKPDYAHAYNNLAYALRNKGKLDEAIVNFRKAIGLRPDYAEAYSNLGNALCEKGQMDPAIAACRQAIRINPDLAMAHYNLGCVLKANDQLDEATAAFRRAISLNPKYAEAHNNLGVVLKDKGLQDEAMACYRQAVMLKPNYVEAHSNVLLALHYHSAYEAHATLEEHRRWNRLHGEPLRRFIQAHGNDSNPDRRLKLGYVSADFRRHPVAQFLLPLLENHDHGKFEVFCYSSETKSDEMTARVRSHADQWREITRLNDEEAAAMIRDDGIDVLVDLGGHTGGNHLLIFARKPAPVQVSYLGYPNTTGLSTMDYRLTDGFADPPGVTDRFHTETLYRLPQTNWCFAEMEDAPPVDPPPMIDRGYVTFGSFNNFAKVTETMMETWGKILLNVPGSRLLLKAPGLQAESTCQRVREIFTKMGIDPSRLDLRRQQAEYTKRLGMYGEVDIALDTFPYHGTTTTCDALWMGVPVVTLAGQSHVSRVSLSLLSNTGLPELAATTMEEYIRLAVDLAGDLNRLKTLRLSLRDRMRASPLMDATGFAREIETAYRRMWRTWCETAANLRRV